MQSEGHIRRMQSDGILTAKQAELLRDSLDSRKVENHPASIDAHRHAHTKIVRWTLMVLGAVIVIGFFLLTSGSGVAPPPQDVATTMNTPGGIGQMNKSFSSFLAIALFLIVPLLLWMWLHNSLVSKEESVFAAWAQTESNMKRRADLIPALVDTVSRYLRHESDTLTAVTGQRRDENLENEIDALIAAQKAAADIVSKDGDQIVENEEELAALFKAQEHIGQRMRSFLAVAEDYPELRSSDQFLELQAQLEGTENRINVARMRFNEAVATYNAAIRRLPASLIAGTGGFQRKAYFQADSEAHDAPELEFD